MSNTVRIEYGVKEYKTIYFERNEFYIAEKGSPREVIVRCTESSSFDDSTTFKGEAFSGIRYGKFEYSNSWLKRIFEPFIGKVIFESNLEKEDE